MAKDIHNPICVGGRENCWYWLIGQHKVQYVQDITFTVDKDQHKVLGFSMKKWKCPYQTQESGNLSPLAQRGLQCRWTQDAS